MSPGYQAVQSSHALIDFIFRYPEMCLQWHNDSNYLIQVVCKNESELIKYKELALKRGIKLIEFFEPDLDNQLTAIALEPTELSRKLISNLPLMLRNVK